MPEYKGIFSIILSKDVIADPTKFKSVSVSIGTYKLLELLRNKVLVDAKLTISSKIEVLEKKQKIGINLI